jgi:hypothetical protein
MSATNYFSFFPVKTQDEYLITHLLARAKVNDVLNSTQSKLFIPYTIMDGDRPESIAEEYYGSTTYFWVVLYVNNIKNIYEDWPKTTEVLNEYIIGKYNSIEYAQNAVKYFEDENGLIIPESEWDGTLSRRISCFDYEVLLNDAKRNIYLVRQEYKDRITKEFRTIFRA